MRRRHVLAFTAAGTVAVGGVLLAFLLPNGCSSEFVPIARRMALPCFVDQRFGVRFGLALGAIFVASLIVVLALGRTSRSAAATRVALAGRSGRSWSYARGIIALLVAALFVFAFLGHCEPWSWFSCGFGGLRIGTLGRAAIVSAVALAVVALVAFPARWPVVRSTGANARTGYVWTSLAFVIFAGGMVFAMAWPGGCGPLGPYLACWVVPRMGLRVGTMFAAATLALWVGALATRRERAALGVS